MAPFLWRSFHIIVHSDCLQLCLTDVHQFYRIHAFCSTIPRKCIPYRIWKNRRVNKPISELKPTVFSLATFSTAVIVVIILPVWLFNAMTCSILLFFLLYLSFLLLPFLLVLLLFLLLRLLLRLLRPPFRIIVACQTERTINFTLTYILRMNCFAIFFVGYRTPTSSQLWFLA